MLIPVVWLLVVGQGVLASMDQGVLASSTFVQITGIHMDPHYQVGAPATCVMGMLGLPCCRASSRYPGQGVKHPGKGAKDHTLLRLAGPHGDLNCDSPPSLVNQTLEAIAGLNPDFVLDLGDRVGHHLLNQSFGKNVQTMAYVASLMSFWNLTVSPAIGNHDTWPIDQWPDAPYTHDLTSVYSSILFDSDPPAAFLEGGYYSTPLTPTVRLVVLNTLWDDPLNLMEMRDGPRSQRKWLNQTLGDAQTKGEKVWLMAHVYPGSNEVKKDWTRWFASMVRTYADTIHYLFFGHTHLDDFVIFDTQAHAGWMPGSIVPFRDHMPSFRVYEWNATSGHIHDYVQYRASLSETHLDFKPVYRASDAFGLKDMEGSSWYAFWQRMRADPSLFQTWWSLHGTGNPSLAPCDQACAKTMLHQRHIGV